jgi:hypothetical protein
MVCIRALRVSIEALSARGAGLTFLIIIGFSVLLSLLSIAIYCAAKGPGIAPALWVYEHWVGINVAAILVAFAVSIWVYLNSFEPGALLALGGNTGNTIYDVSHIQLRR